LERAQQQPATRRRRKLGYVHYSFIIIMNAVLEWKEEEEIISDYPAVLFYKSLLFASTNSHSLTSLTCECWAKDYG